jgi:hypothetical protein
MAARKFSASLSQRVAIHQPQALGISIVLDDFAG